jgi:hypothetical protein
MPAKEIKELRQSGRLEEALKMASEELKAQPDNIWAKRNICWVYYEYLKSNTNIDTIQVFIAYLVKLKDLQLPEEENMVFDNAAYQIGKVLFSLNKLEQPDYTKINQIFDTVKEFHFTKPSESYTFLYKGFHKGYKNWSRYIEFADWWGFNNFFEKDYLKDKMPNGKEVMAIVEQAYIAYSKKILEGFPSEMNQFERVIDKEKINNFLPSLELIIANYPKYQYPAYFKAKLLLAAGDKENVLASFLPFAKQKKNDFWVWELMSDVFENDDERKIACLSKALSLKSPEDFLIKTRQKLAEILIGKDLFLEAKTEIVKIIKTREKHDWKVPFNISKWTQESWYKNIEEKHNNKEFYSKYISLADEILFLDIEEDLVLVEFVNSDKKMLNFIKDETISGFFNYSHDLKQPKIGDVLKVRLLKVGNDGFFKVLTLKKADSNLKENSKAHKIFQGEIRINDGSSYGFVEDIFIPNTIIKTYRLINGQNTSGQAILSYNKKKESYGWKCYNIKNNQ